MSLRVPVEAVEAINAATREWVQHLLGECDPETCVGTHDERWYYRRDHPRY
jgi:hypothetical protein